MEELNIFMMINLMEYKKMITYKRKIKIMEKYMKVYIKIKEKRKLQIQKNMEFFIKIIKYIIKKEKRKNEIQ